VNLHARSRLLTLLRASQLCGGDVLLHNLLVGFDLLQLASSGRAPGVAFDQSATFFIACHPGVPDRGGIRAFLVSRGRSMGQAMCFEAGKQVDRLQLPRLAGSYGGAVDRESIFMDGQGCLSGLRLGRSPLWFCVAS
jgi:hypothetical protein